MIEVSPDVACMLYLGLAICGVIGIWLFQKKKGPKKDIVSFTATRFTCEFCKTSYIDDPQKPITCCPECHSLNKNIR